MDYLDDISKNSFNTDLQNKKPNPKRHREFLENLNIIGQNNIRALYVGVNPRRKYPMKCPKFMGRLAATIIIEDGLWIG